MMVNAQRFVAARELLWSWTLRTIRGRYQQSALGWLWAVIQPVTSVAIFTLIFTRFVPVDTGDVPYAVFSYTAVVPWTLLSASLSDMTPSLVANMNLVKKIYFPREILPVAAMLARVMDAGVGVTLLIILMVIFRVPLFFPGLLFLPLIVLTQLALIVGLGLVLAALNIFYRDVTSLLSLGLQLWFYASPIIYPVTAVPERLRPYYFLNPMAGILVAYRDVLLYSQLPGAYFYPAVLIAGITLLVGFWFFKRVEFLFADIV